MAVKDFLMETGRRIFAIPEDRNPVSSRGAQYVRYDRSAPPPPEDDEEEYEGELPEDFQDPPPPPVPESDDPPDDDLYDEEEQERLKRLKAAEELFDRPPRAPRSTSKPKAKGTFKAPEDQPAQDEPPTEAELSTAYALLYTVEGCPQKFSNMEEVLEHYVRTMTTEDDFHQKHPPTMDELQAQIAKDLQSEVIRCRGYYLNGTLKGDPVPEELCNAMLKELSRQRGIVEPTPEGEPPVQPETAEPPAPNPTPSPDPAPNPVEDPQPEGPPVPPSPADPNPEPKDPDSAPEPEPAPAPAPKAPAIDEQSSDLAAWMAIMPEGGLDKLIALAQAVAAASNAQPPAPPVPAPPPAPAGPDEPAPPKMPKSFKPVG